MKIRFQRIALTRFAPVLAAIALAGCGMPGQGGPFVDALPEALPNAGFEQGLQGWRTGDGDHGMSHPHAGAAKDGKLGLRVVDGDPTQDSRVSTQRYAATGGKRYLLQFDARNLGGRGIGAYIYFYDAGGERLALPGGHNYHVEVPEDASGWKRYSLEAAGLPEAAQIEAVIRSNKVAVVSADFDNLTLVEVAAE